MQSQGLWKSLTSKRVRGENIGQTFQFVNSGNVALGFVAFSQIKSLKKNLKGSFWLIPKTLYSPIKQQAVLLNDNPIARHFVDFVKSDNARTKIRRDGYQTTND